MERCVLDMDGVIVDFHKRVMEHFGIEGINLPKPWPWGWCWDATSLKEQEFWALTDVGFWATMAWTAEGPRILDMCIARFGINNVCLLTNPSGMDSAIIGKLKWIRQHLGEPWTKKVLMGHPKEFCANPQTLLVDDSEANVTLFEKGGGIGFLYPRPWNRAHFHEDSGFSLLELILKG